MWGNAYAWMYGEMQTYSYIVSDYWLCQRVEIYEIWMGLKPISVYLEASDGRVFNILEFLNYHFSH